MNSFGQFLYELRKEKGLTQSQLADMLNVTNKAVSKWETGEAYPETAQLVPLSMIFNVSVDELLKGARNSSNVGSDGFASSTFASEQTCEKDANGDARSFSQTNCDNAEQGGSGNSGYQYNYSYSYGKSSTTAQPLSKGEIVSICIALSLIFIGIIALIMMSMLNVSYGIYVPVLLVSIAIAVFLFVDFGMSRALNGCQAEEFNKGKRYSTLIGLGVAFSIMSPIALISGSAFGVKPIIYLGLFFLVLLLSVILMTLGGILFGNFKKTCQNSANGSQPGDSQANNDDGVYSGIIMTSALIIFLLCGFIFNAWHPAWIVFPIGALLSGLVSQIVNASKRRK